MVKRSRGSLNKSTKKMKKKKEITVSSLVKPFAIGEKVVLKTSHLVEGRIPRRYRGMHGTIVEKRGKSYVVELIDGGKKKQIITNPAYLRKV